MRSPRTIDQRKRLEYAPFVLVAALAASLGDSAVAAEPRVDLEVVLEGGTVPTEAGAWSEMLTQAGFSSVRLRSGTGRESPTLETRPAGGGASYAVIGLLTAENQLLLPKGRYSLRDRGRIEEWLRKLRESGVEGVTVKPAAFGLLPRELVAVHEALAAPVEFATRGQPARDVAKQIAERLPYRFVTDGGGQSLLAEGGPVADELQGLSSGTALAALLRPLGLGLVPERIGGTLRLRLARLADAPEHWPVGWPPQGNPRETLPDLFKFLNVEIAKTPVAEVVAAVAGRLKAPALIDYNAVARTGIDLQTPVNLPRTNTYYDRVLDALLLQAKLRYDLRTDEANRPFLWITAGR